MVWGFLQQSNGSALIKSKVDDGTTVSMYLPKVTLQVDPAVAAVKQERSEPLREGLKVLVVEDQKAVRNVVSDMLTSLGTTVTVVEDGQSALGALSSDNFDLLITDIVLPGGMLGPDIVTQARSSPPRTESRLHVRSCSNTSGSRVQTRQQRKPVVQTFYAEHPAEHYHTGNARLIRGAETRQCSRRLRGHRCGRSPSQGSC